MANPYRTTVTIDGQNVAVLDREALERLGDFDPLFLHLAAGERPRRP